MRCKNCELEHTLDKDEGNGCLIISVDDMTEDKTGECGCRYNKATIKKYIKYHCEVIEPDIIKQMGDFVNFIKNNK